MEKENGKYKLTQEDVDYWSKRVRYHWDEWGSPVGLSLGWAIFVISSAFVIYLLHLSGLI